MAYCSYCSFSLPVRDAHFTCPNCGRGKVKPSRQPPTSYTRLSALQEARLTGSPLNALIGALLFFCVSLVFFYGGFWIHGAPELVFDVLGLITALFAWRKAANFIRRIRTDPSPQKGYLDHFFELHKSRMALEAKIAELESLRAGQESFATERADSRLKLLDAAIANRKLKLALVMESQFVIHSRRKISGLQALIQQLDVPDHTTELGKTKKQAHSKKE